MRASTLSQFMLFSDEIKSNVISKAKKYDVNYELGARSVCSCFFSKSESSRTLGIFTS